MRIFRIPVLFLSAIDETEGKVRAHLESDNLKVLAGAASILTKEVHVSSGKDPITKKLTEIFKKK